MTSVPEIAVPKSVMPSVRFRRRVIFLVCSIGFLAASLVFLRVDLLAIVRDFHYVTNLISEMLPPNLTLLWQKKKLWTSLVETISMAFLGTLGGASIAIVIAFLAATNTSPHRWMRLGFRTVLAAERCTPNIVVLLILLVAVGVGPFAAMLSLMIGSVGMFGKLFADAIEQVDAGLIDATAAVGAGRLQIIRYAVLPQVAPSIIANVFYAFDVNLRAAVALGVFGGGGIGFELNIARSVLRYKDMFACLILIIIMINLMERIADFFRRRIFNLEAILK